MSIGAFIDRPINDKERNFYLPISSERFFESYWLPACKLLNLRWIICFSNGITIDRDSLPEVMTEINRLKIWAIENLEEQELDYMMKRIDLLITQLPLVFTRRDGASVYIG